MSKRLVLSALAQFIAKTAGRNMTKAAYAAVAAGVAAMVVLTMAPAYEMAHRWVDAVLWTCLVYFVFEWLVRLRRHAGPGRLSPVGAAGEGIFLPEIVRIPTNRRSFLVYQNGPADITIAGAATEL